MLGCGLWTSSKRTGWACVALAIFCCARCRQEAQQWLGGARHDNVRVVRPHDVAAAHATGAAAGAPQPGAMA